MTPTNQDYFYLISDRYSFSSRRDRFHYFQKTLFPYETVLVIFSLTFFHQGYDIPFMIIEYQQGCYQNTGNSNNLMTVCINDSRGNGDDHEKGRYEGNSANAEHNYPDNAGEYGRDGR
jgi:hypothetical protein